MIDECLEIDSKNNCDLLLKEDCTYNGTVILEPPIGTIADPQECEELCKQFQAEGCKYWILVKLTDYAAFEILMQVTVLLGLDPEVLLSTNVKVGIQKSTIIHFLTYMSHDFPAILLSLSKCYFLHLKLDHPSSVLC